MAKVRDLRHARAARLRAANHTAYRQEHMTIQSSHCSGVPFQLSSRFLQYSHAGRYSPHDEAAAAAAPDVLKVIAEAAAARAIALALRFFIVPLLYLVAEQNLPTLLCLSKVLIRKAESIL